MAGMQVLQCGSCEAHCVLEAGTGCNCCDFTELAYYACRMQTWCGNKTLCWSCIDSQGKKSKAEGKANSFNKWKWQCCENSLAAVKFSPGFLAQFRNKPPCFQPPPQPPPPALQPSPSENSSLCSSRSASLDKQAPTVSEDTLSERINLSTIQAFQGSIERMNENIGQLLGQMVSMNDKMVNLEGGQAKLWEALNHCLDRVTAIEQKLHLATPLCSDDVDQWNACDSMDTASIR